MTGDFSADEYHDDYRQALMAVIERKVAGEAPEPAQRAEPTNISDLMTALEASVAAARQDRRASAAGDAKAAGQPKASTRRSKAKGKVAEVEAAAPRQQRRRKTA
jgi:DNA end-binding protein Ku